MDILEFQNIKALKSFARDLRRCFHYITDAKVYQLQDSATLMLERHDWWKEALIFQWRSNKFCIAKDYWCSTFDVRTIFEVFQFVEKCLRRHQMAFLMYCQKSGLAHEPHYDRNILVREIFALVGW